MTTNALEETQAALSETQSALSQLTQDMIDVCSEVSE